MTTSARAAATEADDLAFEVRQQLDALLDARPDLADLLAPVQAAAIRASDAADHVAGLLRNVREAAE